MVVNDLDKKFYKISDVAEILVFVDAMDKIKSKMDKKG